MPAIHFNPRYAAWCRSNGNTPDEQQAADRALFPGGVMVAYTQWNTAQLVAYSKINPKAFYCGHLVDHAAYDGWLAETYP